MKEVVTDLLSNIINKIGQYPEDAVIYTQGQDIAIDPVAIIYLFDDEEIVPLTIGTHYYFLEVNLVVEVREVWLDWYPTQDSDAAIFKAVVYYAENDAYLIDDEDG